VKTEGSNNTPYFLNYYFSYFLVDLFFKLLFLVKEKKRKEKINYI
jgi:hypothetical protein